MTSLANIIESIKSEIKVDSQGRGFASIRATARLAGVQPSSLVRAFDSVALEPSKLSAMLAERGFERVALGSFSETGIPDTAVAIIVKYYACHAGRYCNETAQLALDAFLAIGVRSWMQDVAGYTNSTQPKKLSSCDRVDKLSQFTNSLQFLQQNLELQLDNPRIKQELQDFALDVIGIGQKSLPESTETWLGVAERAEQLGYPISLVTNNRSQLGKYVATFGLQSTKENRLCNGTQRPINLYLLSDELDNAIKEFMDAKMLAV
jgi:hypothetical protein